MGPSEVMSFLREIQTDYGIPPECAEDDDPDVVLWNKCHDAIQCVYRLWDENEKQ